MRLLRSRPHQRFLIPEVIQSSTMDCGPASLKALLEGFGIAINYARLREACQTDIDGASIDTLEAVAGQLGLQAEQIMLPIDHLLLPAANTLPAIVVVRLPNGNTHFVVVWRRIGPFLQIMDPGSGRHWTTCQRFLADVYQHRLAVPASGWREWAGGEEFQQALRSRMRSVDPKSPHTTNLLEEACNDPSWRSLAALDAATRLTQALVESGGLHPGDESNRTLSHFYQQDCKADHHEVGSIVDKITVPETMWSVTPMPIAEQGKEEKGVEAAIEEMEAGDDLQLLLKGAVLVRILGRQAPVTPIENQKIENQKIENQEDDNEEKTKHPLSPELTAALDQPIPRPVRELLRMVRVDGLGVILLWMVALSVVATFTVLASFFLRLLLNLSEGMNLGEEAMSVDARQRLFWVLVLFFIAHLLFDLISHASLLRFGRQLEIRFRMRFLRKLPRLHDRYFQSRLVSDMAERSHSTHRLRAFPQLVGSLWRLLFTLFALIGGVLWLAPQQAGVTILAGLAAVVIPLCFYPLLQERELRVRSHVAALSSIYLDAFLGSMPIRIHHAQRAVRREYERLLTEWSRSLRHFLKIALFNEMLHAFCCYGLLVWLLWGYLSQEKGGSGSLLLLYWALSLPLLGQEFAELTRQYPSLRNIAFRLLEPIYAPEMEEARDRETRRGGEGEKNSQSGLALQMHDVSVQAAGHTILHGIDCEIAAGQHVAIVGPSGAGKSSLVSLLLGWYRPASGSIQIDGVSFDPMDQRQADRLRQVTAWVDPSVQLWNQTLAENLQYGNLADGENHIAPAKLQHAIDLADLYAVLEGLPNGMESVLGEGGGLVSGGEGQRVRFGRAALRNDVRLVILDEAFRGLDRHKRHLLLTRARQLWQKATLLCILHDISETVDFDHLLVMAGGTIVEQGSPKALAEMEDSYYQSLLQSEEAIQREVWEHPQWRKLRLVAGRIEMVR